MYVIGHTGNIYTGSFVKIGTKLILHGFGEMLKDNGMSYNGYFVYGRREGQFTVKNVFTGRFMYCMYFDDVFIRILGNI